MKIDDEEALEIETDGHNKYRQVSLVKLNESVTMISGYETDTIEKLLSLAQKTLNEITEGN